MNEDELIKELAEPIIKELEKMEKQLEGKTIQIPQVKLVLDTENSDPLIVDDVEITDEILQKLEEYLQDEIEMMHGPTILN